MAQGSDPYGIRVIGTMASATTDGQFQNADYEIQRTLSSTSSATVPSTAGWKRLITIPTPGAGVDVTHDDLLANDGVYRWYRIRHTLAGSDPSTFLASVIGAKPVILS